LIAKGTDISLTGRCPFRSFEALSVGVDMTQYLKVREVADLFRVSDDTVYAAIADGSLQTIKVRGSYRVSPEALSTWTSAEAVSSLSADGSPEAA